MNDFEGVDVFCFSHLRWNFVYQRPQHLMSRLAKRTRVFFMEEPIFDDGTHYDVLQQTENLWIIIPHLSPAMSEEAIIYHQREFLSRLFLKMNVKKHIAWYYTPMALPISDHLQPLLTVYDCMDELSSFKFAPQMLKELERKLLSQADLVFTGGYRLYEAKKDQHHNIHPFPSSIDYDHFFQARTLTVDPDDQKTIGYPRFGFYGVIDERMNLTLLDEVANIRRDWQFILIGPVAKINDHDLPKRDNIHYLGKKEYNELPAYLAGWDVAMLPFAINESTKFISPTKTPEYLAAGKPVISTPIVDVIREYHSVVRFANTADDFIHVVENDLDNSTAWLREVDNILSTNSWDKTWAKMENLLMKELRTAQNNVNPKDVQLYV